MNASFKALPTVITNPVTEPCGSSPSPDVSGNSSRIATTILTGTLISIETLASDTCIARLLFSEDMWVDFESTVSIE
jgi:hypothetical protein